jgi:hypothetical protein
MSTTRLEAGNKMRAAHKQNILKSLERRLQVAESKGDQSLIRQLEAEMRYCQ